MTNLLQKISELNMTLKHFKLEFPTQKLFSFLSCFSLSIHQRIVIQNNQSVLPFVYVKNCCFLL